MNEGRQSFSSPAGKTDIILFARNSRIYSKIGLTVSEEYMTTSEGIVGLDHHRLRHNKSVHELLICFVFIYLFKSLFTVGIDVSQS